MMLRRILKKYSSTTYWKDKSVLITGINGFIGSNLSKLLISLGAKVIGITDQKNKNSLLDYYDIKKDIKMHYLDISNYNKLNSVINKYKIHTCIHLAAQVDVNIASVNPFLTFESNIRGTYNLLEILRHQKTVKSIIVASSDKAYGHYKSSELPYKETHDLRAKYPYDVSKASGDMIAKSYASDMFKLPVVITRFTNIYGPGQLNFTALIPDCILSCFNYRSFKPRSNGLNKRDFLYVEDVCDLYLCLAYNLAKDQSLRGEVFNAGTGKGYKVKEIIKKVCIKANNIKNYESIIPKFKNKKSFGEIKNQFMTYNKINKLFKWTPTYSLDNGIEKTITWYTGFLKKYNYKSFLSKELK